MFCRALQALEEGRKLQAAKEARRGKSERELFEMDLAEWYARLASAPLEKMVEQAELSVVGPVVAWPPGMGAAFAEFQAEIILKGIAREKLPSGPSAGVFMDHNVQHLMGQQKRHNPDTKYTWIVFARTSPDHRELATIDPVTGAKGTRRVEYELVDYSYGVLPVSEALLARVRELASLKGR